MPSDLKMDTAGNLWVADYDNSRILMFNSSFSNGMNADFVIGQNDLASDQANLNNTFPSADSIYNPYYIDISSSAVWVADSTNNRMLKFKRMQVKAITPSSGISTGTVAVTNLAGEEFPAGCQV